MGIRYREIKQTDNADLAMLIRGVFEEFGIDQPGTVYTDPTTDALFELFQKNNAAYYLAFDQGKMVGGCGIFPTEGLPEGCTELVKFYVTASHRALGIGKKLMEMALNEAKKKGYSSVYLESLPELDKAVGMYEKAGFKHLTVRLGNSGHFACNILMLKEF